MRYESNDLVHLDSTTATSGVLSWSARPIYVHCFP